MPDSSKVAVRIERAGDVLTFTLDNAERGNEINGPMFDAMLSELQREAFHPEARVLRIRARVKSSALVASAQAGTPRAYAAKQSVSSSSSVLCETHL